MMVSPTAFVVTDVRIFTGEIVIENGYVAVQDDKIVSFGAGSPEVAEGTMQISKPGHTLLPGLIDAHIHAWRGNEAALSTALKFGITTVLDMMLEPQYVKKLKTLCEKPESFAEFADMKTAGLGATTGREGYPDVVCDLCC
jgi:N-acetylglucosamine-6-phosphate deacetylase